MLGGSGIAGTDSGRRMTFQIAGRGTASIRAVPVAATKSFMIGQSKLLIFIEQNRFKK